MVTTKRNLWTLALVGFLGLAACSTNRPTGFPTNSTSPTPSATSSHGCATTSTDLTEVAKNLSFDTTCLAAPANKPFTIVFHNEDAGVQHNIAIFASDPLVNPSAKVYFRGQIVTGPATMTYHVGALRPGTYFFHCDVHPTSMKGTLTVK